MAKNQSRSPIGAGRRLAWEILSAAGSEPVFIERSLRARLDASPLLPQDRRLCHAMVLGVARQQQALDQAMNRYLKPGIKLSTKVRVILRLALFQMLYLSRVPDFAVVHDAVEMAKQSGQPAAAALVNAVLRNIQRAGKAKPAGDAKELSPTLLPDYIRRRWQQRWGEKTARAFIERSATQPLFCLRVNLRKTTRQELMRHLEQAQLAPREGALAETIILDRPRGPVVNFPGYAEGWWYVQDQAAQWIPHLVDPQPGEVILDLCAAPGGKTTHLAEMLGPKGRIWAYDITAAKRTRIRENCVRLGLGNVQVAEAVSELPRACDRVLVDAPCSGLGTLNRHLEAGRRVSRSQTQRLQTQQLALLAQAGALVRPGGWLIYATCTTEPEENEGVIAQFLSSRRDFFKVPVAGPFAARDGFFRTFPQALEYDGMFAARLRKKDG